LAVQALVILGIGCAVGGATCQRPPQTKATPKQKESKQAAKPTPEPGKGIPPGMEKKLTEGEASIVHSPGGPQPLQVALVGRIDQAFKRFFDRLQELKEERVHRVRVSVWGDSHIAGEVLVNRLRQRFQKELGDAGPGFVLLGGPWRSYFHLRAKFKHSRSWRSERIWSRYSRRRPEPRDDLFGVPGISVHTRRNARAQVKPRRRRETLTAMDLYYLGQPGGGRLVVRVGRKRLRWVLTVASQKQPGFARIKLPRGTREVQLVTGASGEVRLYGADLENGKSGVVVDAFGINGAKASVFRKWNEPFMKQQLERLDPDLMVLAYGSNEVDSETLTHASYTKELDEVLLQVRRMAPTAACLLVGPPDQARFNKEAGRWEVPTGRLDFLIAAQRRLATLRGCAFWDQRAAMGGPGAIFSWVRADPPLARGDHVHLRGVGYRRIADALYDAVMERWKRYRCRKKPDAAECRGAGLVSERLPGVDVDVDDGEPSALTRHLRSLVRSTAKKRAAR
jgi:lysophospholipase L1-like esterase